MPSKPDPAQEAEALRELLREAHGVLKDLRGATKDASALAPDLVKGQLETAVADGLASYADTIRKAQDEAVAKVNDEFDKLADLLMGRDAKSRRKGQPDIPTLVERMVEGGDAEPATVTDSRKLGGDITGGGGPHDRNAVGIDTRGAVLLDGVTAAVAHAVDGDDSVALLLRGRVNLSRDRARVLYLVDADGAAAIVTELESLLRRAGGDWAARAVSEDDWDCTLCGRYEAAKAAREARLKESGTWQ